MGVIEVRKALRDEIVTRDHGAKLRALIEAELQSPPVIVDFGGLQIASVSFFDEAFGQLALKCGESELRAKVRVRAIDPFDEALMNDIIHSRSVEGVKRARRA